MNHTLFDETDDELALRAEAEWLNPEDLHAQVIDLDYGLAILVDCSGGGSTGDVVSHIATGAIYACMQQGMRDFDWSAQGEDTARIRAMMLDAIGRARLRVAQLTSHGPRQECMATSMMIALFHTDQAIVAHVGGALLYRMRDGRLKQLSRNDASQKKRNADMLLSHEHGSFIGEQRRIPPRGESASVELELDLTQPGDLYLLCSAEVPHMLSAEEIEALLCAYYDHPETAYAALMARVNDHDAHHDSAIILVKLEPAATQMTGFFGRIFSRHT